MVIYPYGISRAFFKYTPKELTNNCIDLGNLGGTVFQKKVIFYQGTYLTTLEQHCCPRFLEDVLSLTYTPSNLYIVYPILCNRYFTLFNNDFSIFNNDFSILDFTDKQQKFTKVWPAFGMAGGAVEVLAILNRQISTQEINENENIDTNKFQTILDFQLHGKLIQKFMGSPRFQPFKMDSVSRLSSDELQIYYLIIQKIRDYILIRDKPAWPIIIKTVDKEYAKVKITKDGVSVKICLQNKDNNSTINATISVSISMNNNGMCYGYVIGAVWKDTEMNGLSRRKLLTTTPYIFKWKCGDNRELSTSIKLPLENVMNDISKNKGTKRSLNIPLP